MKIISKRGRTNPTASLLSRDQLVEIQNCRSNPNYFISTYIKYLDVTSGPQVLSPRNHQLEYVNNLHQARNLIAMMPRQTGSTIISIAFMLWEAMFTDNQRILMQGVNVGNTKTMCDTLTFMLNHLPNFLRSLISVQRRTEVVFSNGSFLRVGAISPNSMRGMSLTRAYFDCFAYAPPPLQQSMVFEFMPAMAQGCKINLTSVPNGPNNVFAAIWADACSSKNSNFTAFKRTVDDISYSVLWKHRTQAMMGQAAYSREYMCEFV